MTFTQAMIITGGGPNNSTMLYALYVYNQAFKYNDMGYACAMSWFMLVVMGLITFIIFKTSSSGSSVSRTEGREEQHDAFEKKF